MAPLRLYARRSLSMSGSKGTSPCRDARELAPWTTRCARTCSAQRRLLVQRALTAERYLAVVQSQASYPTVFVGPPSPSLAAAQAATGAQLESTRATPDASMLALHDSMFGPSSSAASPALSSTSGYSSADYDAYQVTPHRGGGADYDEDEAASFVRHERMSTSDERQTFASGLSSPAALQGPAEMHRRKSGDSFLSVRSVRSGTSSTRGEAANELSSSWNARRLAQSRHPASAATPDEGTKSHRFSAILRRLGSSSNKKRDSAQSAHYAGSIAQETDVDDPTALRDALARVGLGPTATSSSGSRPPSRQQHRYDGGPLAAFAENADGPEEEEEEILRGPRAFSPDERAEDAASLYSDSYSYYELPQAGRHSREASTDTARGNPAAAGAAGRTTPLVHDVGAARTLMVHSSRSGGGGGRSTVDKAKDSIRRASSNASKAPGAGDRNSYRARAPRSPEDHLLCVVVRPQRNINLHDC